MFRFSPLLGWTYMSEIMVKESNKEKHIILKALFGLFSIFLCKLIFTAIMNKEICNYSERIPRPPNVILMNMLGQSKLQKIKIFSSFIVYLI